MNSTATQLRYGPHGRSTPCNHLGPCNDWTHPKTLDEIEAERGSPAPTAEQIIAEWRGVFEPEFWEAVRSGLRD